MLLTDKSNDNILYILKNYKKYIKLEKKNKTNYNNIKKIYELLHESINISNKLKIKKSETDNIEVLQIEFNNLQLGHFFPLEIYDYIKEYINYKLSYNLKINNILINLDFYFLVRDKQEYTNYINYIEKYIKIIKSWLFICKLYTTQKNIELLNLKIFLTPFTKKLPDNYNNNNDLNKKLLSSIHVNTGFTTHLKNKNIKDIIIFRKEEWLKVFIHETIHAFNLDFNNLNYINEKNILKKHFTTIESDFEFNESYCEFWAEIMNLSYYCYFLCNNNYKDFLLLFELNITLEKYFSILQLNKILNYYNLNYELLMENNENVKIYYKENTNVFCYYIIKTILLFNYDIVLDWCNINNINFLEFKKTNKNIESFLHMIIKLKKNKNLIKIIEKQNNKISNNNNLEMSLFEYIP